jgi:Gluconate 2-dehydrogenase subunit 3
MRESPPVEDDRDERRLSDEQEAALAPVLDEVIPPTEDGRLPGAGQLDVGRYVSQALRATPDMEPVIVRGLASLERLAGARSPRGFAALAKNERLAVIGEVLSEEPMFLGMLMFHTYVGYYRHPRVAAALGLAARPPHPAGYPVEPSDLATLLAPVRRRGKLYRES